MATDNEFLRLIYLALANSNGGVSGAGMTAAVRDGVDSSTDIEAIKQGVTEIGALLGAKAPTIVTSPSTVAGSPVELYTFPSGGQAGRKLLLLNPPAGEDWELELVHYWYGGLESEGTVIPFNLFANRATAVAQGQRLISFNFYHDYEPVGTPVKPAFCRVAPENNFNQADAYSREFFIQLPLTRIKSGQCLMFYYPAATSQYYISYRAVPV